MKSPLRILHLEDDLNDAALVRNTLTAEGIACTTRCVQTHHDFVAALELGNIDLVLSDFTLPSFDGLSAAQIVRSKHPDLPLIFVSGTLGEERAIDSLKSGATDYVLKERLTRLGPAVRRAMQEVEERAERRRLEAQFIEGQKMDVIGQLAGGVAHDFNNILAVIIGYSDLLESDLGADSPQQTYNREIRLASDRAARLTQQLLMFSRKQIVETVVLDINELVQELDPMLRRLIDAKIEMKFYPGTPIGHIKADSGYVGQVLMNLAINARDAMPHGGLLTIETSGVTLDEAHAQAHPGATAGAHVMLSVSDTGTGMTEEVKAHLFEAFFTTKSSGKGTGLGLATCQTIAQQSGGHIAVRSELGRGTTFRVYFPQVAETLPLPTKASVAGPLPRGTETLLIVEDDPSVRQLARGILQAQGYEVLTSTNGQDALRVARERVGQPISLVVTDVIMPLMDGTVMAEWLKTTYPELKILFTSGYSDDAIERRGVFATGIEFLAKPYSRTALVCKVREMLDQGH